MRPIFTFSTSQFDALSLLARLMALTVCAAYLSFGNVATAKPTDKRCDFIKSIFVSGEFPNYSIPFVQPESDLLVYSIDIGNDRMQGELRAICENGRDAVCEMSLQLRNGESFKFALPASIRLMRIDESIYIATGIAIDSNKQIHLNNYAVHELLSDRLVKVCNSF